MSIKRKKTLLVIFAAVVLLAVTLSLPPVWSRVSYHSRVVYREIKYWLKPPSEAVFVPSTQNGEDGATPTPATIIADTPTPQPTAAPTDLPAEPTLEATEVPTAVPTPLPTAVLLTGFKPERQFMNNCGPATLSVYLSYYGWGKDQNATAGVLRPNWVDVNVMPYELAQYVNEHTDLRALWRYGGDMQTIKNLISIGVPVMFEKTFEPYTLRNDGWLGHYNLVAGYDDKTNFLTVQDAYLMSYPPWGGNIPVETWDTFLGFDFAYSQLEQEWRSFNYVFIVVYPPEKEAEVLNALGPLANEEDANRIAYERALQEAESLTDVRDQYFAWFNAGTSLVAMEDYENAAAAFDTAFALYPNIPQDSRPYRILWYESGPYAAYYHTGRYQDVIDLASQTLSNMAEPVLEESYYWRALSYHGLGDTTRAINDLRTSLKYHPGYAPSVDMLKQLGVNP